MINVHTPLLTAFDFALALDFTITDVVHEYVSFVGTFFVVGASAFYFLLLRPSFRANSDAMRVAGRSAARIGLVGALLRLLSIGMSTSAAMSEKQLSLAEALTRRPSMVVGEIVTLIALIAFAAAASASRDAIVSWALAAISTLIIALRGLFSTDLEAWVNPVHVFAASMWIGTLFVMVVAGITTVLSGAFATADRGPASAVMVNRFSTIALWSAGVLVLTGVTTAYLHIRTFSALWTSSYGQTLIVKLILVAAVFWLGFHNNRRVRPTLGTEDAARRLNRSATYEIGIAAIVLIVTAVLVNLPAPAEQLAR